MGQCTSVLPPGEMDDFKDEFSIATAQTDPNLPWNAQLWAAARAKQPGKMDLNREFLKIHSSDRQAKCILDPVDVTQSLQEQAEELLRRDHVRENGLPENDIIDVDIDVTDDGADDDVSRMDAASTYTDHNSSFAPSVITTETTATRQITNLDQRATRRRRNEKFSVLGTLDEGSGQQGQHAQYGQHGQYGDANGLGQDSFDQSDFGLHKTLSINSMESWVARKAMHPPKSGLQMYTDVMANCFHPVEREIRKTEYMSVLHLGMKAHLFDYYHSRYLPAFPDAPVPPGLSKMHTESPNLAYSSDGSSSASSDGQLDFGTGPPSHPIHLLADHSVFMDLSVTGSLGLVPRRRPSTSRRKMRGNRKSPDHYIVLMNRRSGIPLAVCARKSAPGPTVVRIYTTKPRVFGQRPAATTSKLGLDWTENSLPLYAFAEIVTQGVAPAPVKFSIFMASGSDGRFASQPSYKAEFLANGSPDIKVVGHTDKERTDTGCALISLRTNSHHNNTSVGRDCDEASFRLSVAQGIDPALFICFTAVVDEILEKSMRTQVKVEEEKRRHQRMAM